MNTLDSDNPPRGWYKHYCLFLLFLVLTFAYADRAILSVVIEGIKQEFSLSDSMVGVLSGPAFAVLYVLAGIPLARWSDIGDRRVVITVCLTIWSVMTALGGMAQSAFQLFMTRVGVGFGEAGASPPSHSLVASYYSEKHHGKAASTLMFASFVGGLIGLVLGGQLMVAFGWRVSMLALGIPGVMLAVLVFLTLREPRRVTRRPRLSEMLDADTRGSIAGLFRKPTYRHLFIGFAVIAFFSQGIGAFIVPFFLRTHGLDEAQVGVMWGTAFAGSALIGTALALVMIDRLSKRNVSWQLRLPALCGLLAWPFYCGVFLAPSAQSAIAVGFIANTLIAITQPAVMAAVYGVAPEQGRGIAIALLGLSSNLIGLGLGPVMVGALSDALNPVFAEQSLRYSLAIFTVFLLWAVAHCWWASRFLANDYAGRRPDTEPLLPGETQ